MPEYSNVQIPKMPSGATEEEINAFNAEVSGLSATLWGPTTQRNIQSDSKDVFVLNEEGNFVPNTSTDTAELAANVKSGRLFVRDQENNLRQIQFETGILALGSNEFKEKLYMFPSEPVQKMEPKAPAFWKYILYPFFSDEIRAYNQLTAVKDAYQKSEYFTADKSAPAAESEEKTAEQTEKKEEQAEKKQPQPKKAIMTSKLENFEKKLEGYTTSSQNTIFMLTMNPKLRTKETILDTMFNLARRTAAREILINIETHPDKRADILAESYQKFDVMMKDLKNFLPKTYDPNELDSLINKGPATRGAQNEPLGLKFDFIAETAMENYQSFIKAGRTDNFRQRLFHYGNPAAGKQYGEPLGVKKDVQPEAQQLEASQTQANKPISL